MQKIDKNKIYNMDCLDGMQLIPDKSIDMILCDLPYGVSLGDWDKKIPFELLWALYDRIIKNNGAIILTASQPFTTDLINSNRKNFKYQWIWNKKQAGNFCLAKSRPLTIHEDILVFSKGVLRYYPVFRIADKDKIRPKKKIRKTKAGAMIRLNKNFESENHPADRRYPVSIIEISRTSAECNSKKIFHPTQKPVSLFEYLIKTYTNEGDTVLDNCIGSGTTAIACINTKRNYIGFEKDKNYFDIALKRVKERGDYDKGD